MTSRMLHSFTATLLLASLTACAPESPRDLEPEAVSPVVAEAQPEELALGSGIAPEIDEEASSRCGATYSGEPRSPVERLQRERNRKRCLHEVAATKTTRRGGAAVSLVGAFERAGVRDQTERMNRTVELPSQRTTLKYVLTQLETVPQIRPIRPKKRKPSEVAR